MREQTYQQRTLGVLKLALWAFLSAHSGGVAAAGWLSGWTYRREVVVDNPAGLLQDYPVSLVFDNGDSTLPDFPFNHAHPSGDDLRMTSADGLHQLNFWIEEWDDSLGAGDLWVKVPSLAESSQTTIYLYYGNPGAEGKSAGDSVFAFYDGFEEGQTFLNAPHYLFTPTYEGSHQVVHPDVVYFPQGWGGPSHQYWMLMTPYPYGNDDYENPSLLASHNGIHWHRPTGLNNPLQPEPANGHNADTDLLFAEGKLHAYYCWYSYGQGGDDSSRVVTLSSTDGVHWSDTTHLFKDSNYIVSPTLLYEDSTFFMWYGHTTNCTADTSTFHRRASADGLNWGPEEDVGLSLAGWVMWHFDIQKNDATYEMVIAAYPRGSSCDETSLFWAQSPDGVSWSVFPTPILKPSDSGWDADQIYRSSFLVEDGLYRIWYSARGNGNIWHVGYAQATLDEYLHQALDKWDQHTGDISVTGDHPRSGSMGLRLVGGGNNPEVVKEISGAIAVTVWIYDQLDTTQDHENAVFIQDASDSYIGIGIFNADESSGHEEYIYSSNTGGGWSYQETDVARTEGWHKLSIKVFPDSSQLLVDDISVGSLDVLDELNIKYVSLSGYLQGLGWCDDAYVRPFICPEPEVSVYDEECLFEDCTPPCSVSRLIPSLIGDNFLLTWSPVIVDTAGEVEHVDHYVVYRGTSACAPPEIFDSIATVTETTFIDTASTMGDVSTNSFYLLRAVDMAGNKSCPSKMIGEYDYDIKTTTGTVYTWIALCLGDQSLQMASDLEEYIEGHTFPTTNCRTISEWNSTAQSYTHYTTIPIPMGDFPLHMGLAYRVEVDASAVLTLTGEVPPSDSLSFELRTTTGTDYSWISIPLSLDSLQMASDLEKHIEEHSFPTTDCYTISEWNPTAQAYTHYTTIPIPMGDFPVRGGRVYRVEVSNDASWPMPERSAAKLSRVLNNR